MLVKLNVNEINKENDMKVYVTKSGIGHYIFYENSEKAREGVRQCRETYKGTVDLDIVPEPCEPPKKWVKKEMNAWLEQTVDAQLPKGQQLKNIKLTYEVEE
jgi:hypothetical protein